MPKLDSAVGTALSLNPALTNICSHGSSGFSSTFKITTETNDGVQKSFFMKKGKGPNAETMFRGEFASLNALHSAVPSLSPAGLSHGPLADSHGYYLITDFLNLNCHPSDPYSSETLATKLAKLHSTPAPAEYNGKFGFPVPTCCGSTIQDNTWEASWVEFFGRRRLLHILAESERNNGADKKLRDWVEKTVAGVMPRLLGRLDVKPVVVHGDLWSGNASRGCFGTGEKVEEVVFDPSGCFAHNEYEFGIMKMFGGFREAFFDEYHKIIPKTEPVEEYDDRVELYMLYHQLNHHALFGGGYRSGAIRMMETLYAKYGEGK